MVMSAKTEFWIAVIGLSGRENGESFQGYLGFISASYLYCIIILLSFTSYIYEIPILLYFRFTTTTRIGLLCNLKLEVFQVQGRVVCVTDSCFPIKPRVLDIHPSSVSRLVNPCLTK